MNIDLLFYIIFTIPSIIAAIQIEKLKERRVFSIWISIAIFFIIVGILIEDNSNNKMRGISLHYGIFERIKATIANSRHANYAGFKQVERFVFTKKVLSWQRTLSPLESQLLKCEKHCATYRKNSRQ